MQSESTSMQELARMECGTCRLNFITSCEWLCHQMVGEANHCIKPFSYIPQRNRR